MNPRTFALIGAIASLLAFTTECIAVELLTNGGFETGNFSGWTATPAASGSRFGVQTSAAHSGTFNAFFGGTTLGSFDSITQTVPTIPGALYQISFWLRNDGNPSNLFQPFWGGENLADIGIQPPFAYKQFVFPDLSPSTGLFELRQTVATSASTVLQLRAYHLPSFWRLDDVSVMRICVPNQTGSQQLFGPGLPTRIPTGRTGGDFDPFFFLIGTGTRFENTPQATSASIYVCIDDIEPQNLKVVITPFASSAPASAAVVLWDHEQFVDNNGQPVKHIEALANLPFAGLYPDPGSNPPTYSYQVTVLGDKPGPFFDYIGTFNSSVLTLNPSNPGHIGMPIVNLYADQMFHPLPSTIEFGDDFSVFATAIGNPSSYRIDRLGLKIIERVDIDPLRPDPAHPLPTHQQHNSGIGPESYIQANVAQPPSSTTGVGLNFEPPDLPVLPPGFYEITATAWDSAGFSRKVTRNLTVTRSFGFLSVANLVRQVNTTCDESVTHFPCNTTTFSATLNLINNTSVGTGNLRIRLVSVPGSASTDQANVTLPAERDFTPSEAFVGPVVPLLGCSAQQVRVCGVIPKPDQTSEFDETGVGYQAYAVLEQCDATAAECANPVNADLWIPVDTIKVTEGEWPVIAGFAGPGGGTNQDRRGGRGRNAPFVLDSLAITGPATVADLSTGQFRANATLKKANGTVKQLSNVKAQWSASMFSINSTGLFQAGHVTVNTPVTITATYSFGGVTKSQIVEVIVTPPVVAAARAAAVAMAPDSGNEMSVNEMADFASSGHPLLQKKKKAKPPNVTLSVFPTSINEGGAASITVSVNKINATQPVTVGYSLTGTAQLNTHYTVCGEPGRITIPAGAASAQVRLTALANDLNLGAESLTISLSPSSAYKLPKRGAKATINITNVAAPLCP